MTNEWKPPSFIDHVLNDDGGSFLNEKKRIVGKAIKKKKEKKNKQKTETPTSQPQPVEMNYADFSYIPDKWLLSALKTLDISILDVSGNGMIELTHFQTHFKTLNHDLVETIFYSIDNDKDKYITIQEYEIWKSLLNENTLQILTDNYQKYDNVEVLSDLEDINVDEKYDIKIQETINIAPIVKIKTDEEIKNNLDEYLEKTMKIKSKINIMCPKEIILSHSYYDDKYGDNVKITPISPDPVLCVHLDFNYIEWDMNTQNKFISELALELDINPSQLIPICVSSGSVKFIIQICNIIKDKFPLIEKKCVTLKENTNKICSKWKLKAATLKNWASNKLISTNQPSKLQQIKDDDDDDDICSKLDKAEKWLVNQAELLRNQIIESLQDCREEYQISGICALDNDKCLNEFIKFDGWKDSKLLFHGTKLQHLTSIYKNGFDDKFIGSVTDPGWFGKGHYFSSYPSYCMAYCEENSFKQRTLFVCYVNLGNTFQVYDDVTFYGKSLKKGYESHYVKVKRNGVAVDDDYDGVDDIYDEYVIKTGKRVLPRFCVTFTKKESIIIWRDAKLLNRENIKIRNKLRKRNVIYGALTNEDALKLIKKKKDNNTIGIITNGGDNAQGFINSIRNESNVQNSILVFPGSYKYRKMFDKLYNVNVATDISDLYQFVNKYLGNDNISNHNMDEIDIKDNGDDDSKQKPLTLWKKYIIIKTIGRWHNISYLKLTDRRTKKKYYDMIVIPRTKTDVLDVGKSFHSTCNILNKLQFPTIRKTIDYSSDTFNFYRVTTAPHLRSFTEMLNELKIKKSMGYSEYFISQMIGCIFETILFCHKHDIVNFNLNINNLAFDNNLRPILLDFSRCIVLPQQTKIINDFFSVMSSTPPELALIMGSNMNIELNGIILRKVDSWRCGVLLYVLITGRLPYHATCLGNFITQILTLSPIIPIEKITWISHELKDLLLKLLETTYFNRIDIKDAIKHKWFKTTSLNTISSSTDIIDNIINLCKVENARNWISTIRHKKYSEEDKQLNDDRKYYDRLDPAGKEKLIIFIMDRLGYCRYRANQIITEYHSDINNKCIEWKEFVSTYIDIKWNESDKLSEIKQFINAIFGGLDPNGDGFVDSKLLLMLFQDINLSYTKLSYPINKLNTLQKCTFEQTVSTLTHAFKNGFDIEDLLSVDHILQSL